MNLIAPKSLGIDENFLRSINLCLDLAEPERISHFRPTSKSIPLIQGLCAKTKERAFLVVAPYGSGKSITLVYIANIIENRADSQMVLAEIENRIEELNPQICSELRLRRDEKRKGMVLALHGFQGNIANALKDSAIEAIKRNNLSCEIFNAVNNETVSTIESAIELLERLKSICIEEKLDEICILWDETGRHLETLITDGRAAELSDIQVLAEYASRSSKVPITLGITLHQSMLHYAQQMTQSIRAEWQKISGRFETIQYVDDSKETYRLISEIIDSKKSNGKPPAKKQLSALAKLAKNKHGFFKDFSNNELEDLLTKTFPVNPAALYILPRVSARVSQNERTLFTFLYSGINMEDIDIPSLYDYFASAMRSDTMVGGTYKQWLETESAISKTEGDRTSIDSLKAACLLSLGIKGERNRIEKSTLIFALKGYENEKIWERAVSRLIDKKLLLYRQHSKEVSVWHGTDADLRGHLSEEKDRKRAEFNLLNFLNQEAPAEAWKPIEYNTRFGVNRYWNGEYYTASDFDKLRNQDSPVDIPIGCDGKILYLVAETIEELCDAIDIAESHLNNPQIIAAFPCSPLHLREAALEVWCLKQMQNNTDLTGEDPFILPEIKQMLDDARSNLMSVLDKLISPNSDSPLWYHKRKQLHIKASSDLRICLTEITEEVFPDTPILHNELINRDKPSGTIVNSRKKLLMGILERHGTRDLGLVGTTPEASMFRTLLCQTELYRESSNGKWEYASGKTQSLSKNVGLKKVWNILKDFFESPSDDTHTKSPSELFDKIVRPPFGLRRGVLPILFAAGMKAFARAISLTHKGVYVKDILPTVVEDICNSPKEYKLEVLELNSYITDYFDEIRNVFLGTQELIDETDLVRATYDSIQGWLYQLPKSALTSKSVSPEASKFQKMLLRSEYAEPIEFFLTELPQNCNFDYRDILQVRSALTQLKSELESVTDIYVRKACDSIIFALSQNQLRKANTVQKLAKHWANLFPHLSESSKLPGIAKGLLKHLKSNPENEEDFINPIAVMIVRKKTGEWDDSTAIEFERKIQELITNIESTAIHESRSISYSNKQQEEILKGLANLVTDRIQEFYDQLVGLVGPKESSTLLRHIIKGNNNGDS